MKNIFLQDEGPEPRGYRLKATRVIALSVTGLAVLTLLAVNPFSERAIVEIESDVILLLNDTLGQYAPWDWFVILGAHTGILFGVMVFLLALFAIEGWRMRRSDYGRVYGYGLLVILLALAVGFAVDVFSYRLAQRAAPWTMLGGLDDLRQFYTTEILTMSLSDGYVDGNLVAWCCAVVLLWNRAPRTATIMLGFIVVHGFSEVALGEQWPIAHLLALLVGALIGGAGLLRLDPLFANAERHMADFFVARAWRQLTPEGLSADSPAVSFEKARLVITGADLKERNRAMRRIWRKLVLREVLPVISLHPGEYVFSRKPPKESEAPFKPSRFVRFIRSPRGEVFVIKAAWRWSSPFGVPKRIRLYRLHARNTLALERLSFPVPRLYWVREGMMNFGLRRYFLLVEEFLPGRPLDRSSYEEASEAIRLLAQLHENKRIGWGAISETGKTSTEEYVWTYLRPRIMYLLNRVSRLYGSEWPSEMSTRIWSWFEAMVFGLMSDHPPPFRLIHGDVSRNNFIHSGDSVKMLDLLTLRYDWAGWEIVKATVSFSTKDDPWRHRIWQDYFQEAGNARWREFLRQSGIGVGCYVLWEYGHERAFGVKKGLYPGDPERFASRLHTIMHDRSLWGATPAETDWDRLNQLFNAPLGSLDSDLDGEGARIIEAAG